MSSKVTLDIVDKPLVCLDASVFDESTVKGYEFSSGEQKELVIKKALIHPKIEDVGQLFYGS